LWQRVKSARFATIGNEKLARTFGCAFEEDRSFHFQKALLVHENPGSSRHLASQTQVAGHFWPAQIEVAVLQAQFLIDLVGDFGVVHREREHIR